MKYAIMTFIRKLHCTLFLVNLFTSISFIDYNLVFAQLSDYTKFKDCQLDSIDNEEVFSVVEKMPEYKGGVQKFCEDIRRNIKIADGVTLGCIKIYVSFIIDSGGNVRNICTSKNIILNAKFVDSINYWSAGVRKGKKVPVKMAVPMYIILR